MTVSEKISTAALIILLTFVAIDTKLGLDELELRVLELEDS